MNERSVGFNTTEVSKDRHDFARDFVETLVFLKDLVIDDLSELGYWHRFESGTKSRIQVIRNS